MEDVAYALSVSVIIPCYTMDRWELLRSAVESACDQTVPPAEVLVAVDSNPELLAKCRETWSPTTPVSGVPIRVICSAYSHDQQDLAAHVRAHGAKRRFGAGEARNSAAEQATSEILAFLDDDAAAEKTWLEQLLKPYEHPGVLAVGGAPQPRYETERPKWFPAQFDWVFGCAFEGMPTAIAPFPRLIGANMSVRAEVLKQIGGFHSIDLDDMDMCHRVSALGGPTSVVFNPAAVVHHYVPAHRTSWRYFWRRCFHVNRAKVKAHRDMGSASSFAPDLAFVARTLTVGIMRELYRAVCGDRYAVPRVGAIIVGVASAGLGNVAGRAGRD